MLWLLIAAICTVLLVMVLSPFRQPYSFDESVFGDATHKEIHARPEDPDPSAVSDAAEYPADPTVPAASKGKSQTTTEKKSTEKKPTEKKSASLGVVFGLLWVGSAWGAPPSSLPTSHPRSIKPPQARHLAPASREALHGRRLAPASRETSRTNNTPAAERTESIKIDEQGLLRHNTQRIDLANMVRLGFAWKQQQPAPTLRLLIHPRAPYGVIRTVQSVLRGTGLSFTEETDLSVPSIRQLPPTPISPTASADPTPTAKPQPSPAQEDPSQIAWHTVALATEAELKTPANLEIRAQLVSPQGQPIPSLATGITRYVGKRRQPLARQRSNALGLVRYAILRTPQDHLRIAVLSPQGYLEFPVPLQDAAQGILYLQIPISLAPAQASVSATNAARIPTPSVSKTKQPPAALSTSKSTNAPPSASQPTQTPVSSTQRPTQATLGAQQPTQTPNPARPVPSNKAEQERLARIRPAEMLPPSAPNDPLWQSVPLGRAEDLPAFGGIELRGRIFLADGAPAADMPTGLLLRQTERHKPIGRSRTDKQGRFRYLVSPDRTRLYDVVVLYANRLHLQSLPLPAEPKPLPDYVLRLDLRALHKLFAEGVSIVVERLSSEALRVTHFVSLLFHQNDANTKAEIVLPLPSNHAKVELDKQIAAFKPNVLPRSIQFTATMTPGRNRFAYSYLLPLQEGRSQIDLLVAFPSEQLALFLDPALRLDPQRASRTVKLGDPGQERNFAMFQLPSLNRPGLGLALSIADPTYVPQSRLMAWLREWKQQPNKRNKLLGLSVLLVLSFLGAFLLLASPSPRPTESERKTKTA